jgi:iron complex outermembrane receptor protein
MLGSHWCSLLGLAFFLVALPMAQAQERAAGSETVIVTGKRMGLEQTVSNGALGQKSLLDTPFSVTVIDAEDIYRRQADSIAQIFINDPSVSSSSTAGTTNWWGPQIRGLGVRNYYVDGVPMVLSWGGEFPLEPVEAVEALKGLTGFMYGFGAPGGVLEYETKKPTDTPLLSTSLGYRNDGVFSGHLDAGGPLGEAERLGYRVNIARESGDAFTGAGVDRTLVALALDYEITDKLEWYANVVDEDSNLKHEPLYFYWDVYPDAVLPMPTYDYDDVTVRNSFYETAMVTGTTGVRWNFSSDWRANVVVGESRKDHFSNKMFGYLLNQGGDYEGNAYNFAGRLKGSFSQVMVQGSAVSGSVRHELVFGAGQQRSTGQWSNDWYWSNDFNGNLYQSQPFLVTRALDFSFAPVSEDQRQTAAFASDTLHFGERWQAIFGARYTDYELVDLDGDPFVESGYTTDAVSPTLAVIFKPAARVSIYGSFVESLEEGVRVGPLYANAGEILDATVSNQYEVGAKYDSERFSFTTAAFSVERAAQIDRYVGGLRYLSQDGVTMYDGVELIGSVGLTSNLRFGFGAVYLDPTIEEVSEDNIDLQGNEPAGAMKRQVVASLDYDVESVPGLSVFGSVRYFGDAYYEDANVVVIPNRTLVNVSVQYETALFGRQTDITGSLNNVFDKKYWELNTLGEGINGSVSLRVSW